jgi:hypothetical protein
MTKVVVLNRRRDEEFQSSVFCATKCRRYLYACSLSNPLTPNDLQRRRAVSPLKIKIPSKNMREKPTNATISHSVY